MPCGGATVPDLFAKNGDAHAKIDDSPCSLEHVLELAAKQEADDKKKTAARRAKHPLIVIAQAAEKEDALAGLDRWKAKHPDVAAKLAVDDVLVDAMRGRHKTWTRIRINLRNVPESERPPQETPDPDYDARIEWQGRRRE